MGEDIYRKFRENGETKVWRTLSRINQIDIELLAYYTYYPNELKGNNLDYMEKANELTRRDENYQLAAVAYIGRKSKYRYADDPMDGR